ncbi:MAG: hypothetical protein MI924_18370 [Chloroflexales bacterium]|nr:hypothetical protein [Chloroflexales bacterium]
MLVIDDQVRLLVFTIACEELVRWMNEPAPAPASNGLGKPLGSINLLSVKPVVQ